MSRYGRWAPYVPVATRRANALKKMAKLRKKGQTILPVEIEGKKIAKTFWGKAWCDHIELFSDFDNRLPRGRTYVRNGSVCHLEITKGKIKAMVIGSEIYKLEILVKTLSPKKWKEVRQQCSGQISSILELLQGKLSKNVMEVVTNRKKGLFPLFDEIELNCNCPDWAIMCKHVAAALYGVGARLDEKPELLFLLRGVDHEALISENVGVTTVTGKTKGGRKRIADDALADVFGIEMSQETTPAKTKPTQRRKQTTTPSRKTSKVKAKQTIKHNIKRAGSGLKATKKSTKKVISQKVKVDKKRTSQTTSSTRLITGKAVAKLRAKFGMSKNQFALLLGVSVTSISNWEKRTNSLNLQPRTLEAWNVAKKLTKKQALQKANRSKRQ